MSSELMTHLNTTTLVYKLRKQMEKTSFNENFQASSELADGALKMTMVLIFVLNIIFANGMMEFFVKMINSLQLIIHLPMMAIVVPANVQTFFQAIVPIVCFDILSDFGIFEMALEFDEDQQDHNNIFILD